MYYIRHYYISGSKDPNFKNFLESKFSIPCDSYNYPDGTYCYNFDLPENHPLFPIIEPQLPKPTPQGAEPWKTGEEYVSISYYPQYTEQEFQNAKWYTMRSSFSKVWDEASRDTVRKATCSDGITVDYFKGRHNYIFGDFMVDRAVKWGNHFFASSVAFGEEQIFCSSTTKSIMEEAGIRGIEFQSVRKPHTGKTIEDLFYMNVLNTIPDGAVVAGEEMDSFTCICGMHMLGYHNTRGTFRINAQSFDQSLDFVRTLPLFVTDSTKFHEGKTGGGDRLLVSRRFYEFVKTRKMDRALWFEPVEIIP